VFKTAKGLQPRDYLIEEYTRTVCPECFSQHSRRSDEANVFKDGMLISRDQKVWLRRYCSEHGVTESIYEEDLEVWRARSGWNTPTLSITPDRENNFGGFPEGYRQGLPASHGQHTCILVLNITERCNFACPTCYADALKPGSPAGKPELPSIEQLMHTVDTVLKREGGKLGVVMLSGGEPTIRKDLDSIIERLCKKNITRVMLNTNGRRIVKDDKLVQLLCKYREKVEVYLQFDGVTDEPYQVLRGESLAQEKVEILQKLNESQVFTTLVMTVQEGVNEHQVGEVVKVGLGTPFCAGLAIQPVFGSGRGKDPDPLSRTTPTGVMRRLEEQTEGLLRWQDFIPLPCSHKDCCDITYMLKTKDDGWRSLPHLIGREELKNWIGMIANTITFDQLKSPVGELLKSGALNRVFSEQLKVGTTDLALDLSRMCDCIPGLQEVVGGLWSLARKRKEAMVAAAQRTFRITVKMFMDTHTFHESRIRQCCVHTGTFEEDPRRYSFCWRWMFEDARDLP
jgi:uncharacterized radical SAM superfamily Fe-S cluster-containing enzyme